MTAPVKRCAIYTRKSSEEGLEQAFNSLDAQREACLSYIKSQRGEGWKPLSTLYDDGGFSGGTMDRPALKQLMADIGTGLIDVVVVYKVDRLTRALADFAKIVELFDSKGVSFVSVTQQFNTTSSMGRLTLNVLLSFAQFEREVTGERIRDKIAASKRKGMWMGGRPPLGYEAKDRTLAVVPGEAELVRVIFGKYLELASVHRLRDWLQEEGHRTKTWTTRTGRVHNGHPFCRGALYTLLQNPVYRGEIAHKGSTYPGAHTAIIDRKTWDRAQALLAQNRNDHSSRVWVREPSLLTGLLYDSQGNRLTPSHANKAGKRYRYYVGATATRGKPAKHPALRIPGHDLERLVVGAIREFLADDHRIEDLLRQIDLPALTTKSIIRDAARLATDWPGLPSAEQMGLLRQMIRRITIDEKDLTVELAPQGLCVVLLARNKELEPLSSGTLTQLGGQQVALTIPAALKRCGSEMRLIVSNEDPNARPPRPNAALIKAIARAHVWRAQLLAGKAASLDEIARNAGLAPRYIRQLFDLAYLSPRIVELILDGRQPPELTLDDLTARLPIDWRQQEERLGLKPAA